MHLMWTKVNDPVTYTHIYGHNPVIFVKKGTPLKENVKMTRVPFASF